MVNVGVHAASGVHNIFASAITDLITANLDYLIMHARMLSC